MVEVGDVVMSCVWAHKDKQGAQKRLCGRLVFLLFSALFISGCAGHLQLEKIPNPFTFFAPSEVEGEWRASMRSRSFSPSMLPVFEIQENAEFYREANHFLGPNSKFIVQSLERLRPHESMLRQILADEGLPPDVLALAMVESGFRLEARSNMGAAGPWQFMKSTARLYGLKVSRSEDQRLDPVLSTLAAARHLRDLHRLYGDWPLVFAAYNAGTGSVQRAMRRGQSNDFWVLARKKLFKQQTIRYVPKVMAVAAIVRYIETACTARPEECMQHLRARLEAGKSIVIK